MKRELAIALATSAFSIALMGCGSSNGGGAPAPVPGINGGLYANGLPYPQSAQGCMPLGAQIPFYATGAALDATNDIIAGTIPTNTSVAYGTMYIGTSQGLGGTSFSESETSGNLQLYVTPANYQSYTATTANVSGALMVSGALQQQITYYFTQGSYGGYPSYNISPGLGYTAPCVSGMAIQGHLFTTGGNGFGGQVYLYLNNTAHGWALAFY